MRALRAAATLVCVPVLTVTITAGSAGSTLVGNVTIYGDPSIAGASAITTGPDGALWFTNGQTNSIGRITTDGTVTNYTDPSIIKPSAITAGPDGALWFTNAGYLRTYEKSSIGRITTDGTITKYTNQTVKAPMGITAGPDGALWFTNSGNSSIGRITTAGKIRNFTDVGNIRAPRAITVGSDGALWFGNGYSIGRIGLHGRVSIYEDADFLGGGGIAAGPDGAIWIAEPHSIWRISPVDRNLERVKKIDDLGPSGHIAAGADGALWFDTLLHSDGSASIGRITASLRVTQFDDPRFHYLEGITQGPDGAVWFTNINTIGRITAHH
jgi:virginiamycin B lyase